MTNIIYNAYANNFGGVTALSTSSLRLVDFGFTQAQVDMAKQVLVSVSIQPCRFAFRATPSSNGLGHPLSFDSTLTINGTSNILSFRIVADTPSALVSITLFK